MGKLAEFFFFFFFYNISLYFHSSDNINLFFSSVLLSLYKSIFSLLKLSFFSSIHSIFSYKINSFSRLLIFVVIRFYIYI